MARRLDPPGEVAAILKALRDGLNRADGHGGRIGDAKHGVYAFWDYDGEPIYVGQTREGVRTRIQRHLTNQRSDAVAMSVLDPFEVADVEVWPFWHLSNVSSKQAVVHLRRAEFTVYSRLLQRSRFGAVLNEVAPEATDLVDLPPSIRWRIVPDHIFNRRIHPDTRIAQRAATIARLTDVISRRQVRPGLRATLVVQARRLLHLSESRLGEVE